MTKFLIFQVFVKNVFPKIKRVLYNGVITRIFPYKI